jgi:lipid-binding SYLF domain-containing protein
MAAPDKGIPNDLLAKAECVIVIPSMKKGAFIVGGQFGRGFAECRQGTGWGAPAAMEMEGGSVGLQIGGSATDLILLVMNRKGMDRLMGDKFTLGGDASVAAGPVGRTTSAETNARMDAEILSWSRAKGVFGGISLKGASLRPDKSENKALYGKEVSAKEILSGGVKAPADATALAVALTKLSPSTSADRKQ